MSHLSDGLLFFENMNSTEIQNGCGDSFHFARGGKRLFPQRGASGSGKKVHNHSGEIRLQMTVFGFHVGHHVGQMVKMLADMMADMKILKTPIHHGFFCSIESCWPTWPSKKMIFREPQAYMDT